MKVLFLTNAYPTTEKPWEGAPVQLQAEGLRRMGAVVEVLHLQRSSGGRWIYFSAYSKIKSEFNRGKFDLLHVHFGGVQALLGALVAKQRCVITYHGTDLHGGKPQGLVMKITSAAGVRCSILASKLSGASIVVSRTLLPYLGSHARATTVIPTGVDYQRFFPMDRIQARRELGLDEELQYILFCDNNGDPVKRRDLAEQTQSDLQGEFPQSQLLVLNHVPFDRVPLYLNAADTLLVTSDKEGSPNIVKEAIACNVPVISVDVGDVSEMISGLKNCHIAERNPRSLSAALKRVLLVVEREDGRDKKKEFIDNDSVCRAIFELYKNVLGRTTAEGLG